MQEQEEEEEEIERERGRSGAFFKGIINSLNALFIDKIVQLPMHVKFGRAISMYLAFVSLVPKRLRHTVGCVLIVASYLIEIN